MFVRSVYGRVEVIRESTGGVGSSTYGDFIVIRNCSNSYPLAANISCLQLLMSS